MEPFFVKHYSEDERPTIKGNGFDGLEIGQDRDEAEAFVAFINSAITALNKIARTTGSDDPCRRQVDIARTALLGTAVSNKE